MTSTYLLIHDWYLFTYSWLVLIYLFMTSTYLLLHDWYLFTYSWLVLIYLFMTCTYLLIHGLKQESVAADLSCCFDDVPQLQWVESVRQRLQLWNGKSSDFINIWIRFTAATWWQDFIPITINWFDRTTFGVSQLNAVGPWLVPDDECARLSLKHNQQQQNLIEVCNVK